MNQDCQNSANKYTENKTAGTARIEFGKKLDKEIYQNYGSLGDFVVNFAETSEEVVKVKPKSITYRKIHDFLTEVWNPEVDREIIFRAVATEPLIEPEQGLEDIQDVGEQEKLF